MRMTTEAVSAVDGVGYVFDPDPLTTAGVEYGPPYVNANDADIHELNAQRVERPLREISLSSDGRYLLDGPYVRIVGGDVIGHHIRHPSPRCRNSDIHVRTTTSKRSTRSITSI
jgi:hypothetical protein